jgi:Uma2 family endonuclease
VRVPDLVMFSEELGQVMTGATCSLILMDMLPPLLVVEVVSANQENRDYRYKHSEYAARGIAEYWIVDPTQQKVTVLESLEGFYEEQVLTGDQVICSPLFPDMKLTVTKVL